MTIEIESSTVKRASLEYYSPIGERYSDQTFIATLYAREYGYPPSAAFSRLQDAIIAEGAVPEEIDGVPPDIHSVASVLWEAFLAGHEQLEDDVIIVERASRSVVTPDEVLGWLSPDPATAQWMARRAGLGDRLPNVGAPAAVSNHTIATQAGMEILSQGGTAADAAFTIGAVLSVVEPFFSSVLGGGSWILYYDAERGVVDAVDGVGPAPAAATPDRFRDTAYLSRDGMHRAIVPGAWGGWMALLERHGVMPLDDLLEPAIFYANNGVPATGMLLTSLRNNENFVRSFEPARSLYIRNNNLVSAGDTIRHTNMGRTFQRLASAYDQNRHRGEIAAFRAANDFFYRGPIANDIVAFSEQNAGLLTREDFAGFAGGEIVEPISINYRGLDVYQNPPNSQGIVMLQALSILHGFDFSGMTPTSPNAIHLMTEALKLAFADRTRYLGDPAFVDVPVDTMLSTRYAEFLRESISPDRAMRWPIDDRLATYGDGGHTTTFQVIDRYGNAASVTTSIGISFVVAGETGIHMNERLAFMSNNPDDPNALAPGKKVRHTSNPYIALRNGVPYIIGGNTGADVQPQAQLQQFMNIVDFGLSAQEAVDHPRFRTRAFPDTIVPYAVINDLLLEAGYPTATRNTLANRGHTVNTGTYYGHGHVIIVENHSIGDISIGAETRQVESLGTVLR